MDNSMTSNPLSDWLESNTYAALRSDVEEFFSGAGQIKDRLKVMYVFIAISSALVGFFSSMDKDFLPSTLKEELDKASSSLADSYSNLRAEFGQDMDILDAIGSDGQGLRSRCELSEFSSSIIILLSVLFSFIFC